MRGVIALALFSFGAGVGILGGLSVCMRQIESRAVIDTLSVQKRNTAPLKRPQTQIQPCMQACDTQQPFQNTISTHLINGGY